MKAIVKILLFLTVTFPVFAETNVTADAGWLKLKYKQLATIKEIDKINKVRFQTSDDKDAEGHVCGTLILETKEKITSLKTFLNAKGKGAKAEPVPWEEYKDEQPPSGEAKPNTVSTPPKTPYSRPDNYGVQR
jgi:hypothetical protein